MTQEQKSDKISGPCQVILSLTENVVPYLERGYIAHQEMMTDLPEDLFFIADSYKKILLGPFVRIGDQYKLSPAPKFHRGVPVSILTECPWVMNFRPHPEIIHTNRALPWQIIARHIGAPYEFWNNLRQNRFAPEQFIALCNEMIRISQTEIPELGVINIVDFGHGRNDCNNYLESFQHEPTENEDHSDVFTEQEIVDEFYGGEWAIYEANRPDY